MTNGIPHPFEIFWDVDSASYYIFVPDGCVLVNGVAATNDEVDNGNLALDFGDTPPEKVYCHVSKEEDEESGESSWKFTIDGEAEEDGAKYNVLVATFGQSENDGQSYDVVCSAISLGGSGEIVGDYDGSETISGDEEPILITGHPGEEDAQGHDSHSGLQFLTVGARTDEETGEKIPPKIVARIIDKAEDEDWAARSLTVTPAEGSPKTVHFLGSEDIDIEIPSVPKPPDPLEGSDYIDVDTAVSAKVATPANQQAANAPNALLTHNTDQLVRSKKTFLGLGSDDNALKKVIVDGPNGKVEVQNAAGNRIIKLDAADIPNECGQGGAATLQVRKLTVTHPRTKDGKTADIYHVIGCADIDVQEGDAIDTITSGTPTQSGGFTLTPVTIKLKDGTSLPAFNVNAKNGEKGDDGASVSGATAGTPVVDGNTTTTPITFTLSDGTTIGPINVVSTNGVSASGSDYIEVGDGTGATTKGQVKAKVPADGSKGLLTTDTEQAISAAKTIKIGAKSIVLNPSQIPDGCQKKEISVKTLTVTHRYAKDGKASETYHILGCDDVEIAEGDIKKLTFKKTGSPDVEFDGTADKTVEMTVRNLVAGSGISLTPSGNNITITNTAQGGGGGTTEEFTGTAPWLDGFKYDKTTHKLMYRFGSIRFENGLAVEYTPGDDDDFVDVPGGDAVEETV